MPLRSLLSPQFAESELDALLAREDTDEALALLLGDHGERALIRRDTPPLYRARYGMGEGVYASLDASLPTLAMIGAWARYFSELRGP
jgi:hypothetical protein